MTKMTKMTKMTMNTMTTMAATIAFAALAGCKNDAPQETSRSERTAEQAGAVAVKDAGATTKSGAERGRYLVTVGACNDCHTPLAMGPNGPAPDMSRQLSGHPASLQMPPAPKLPPGPWLVTVAATNTAWAGPWGVSFTANLTPDKETGLGAWTKQTFIDTIRNGRHMGKGRPLLPPMPVAQYATLTDEDLGAIFDYLQTIPAISNRVPEPLPPAVTTTAAALPAK